MSPRRETEKKKDAVKVLQGKLTAAEHRANDNQEFYLKHERKQHDIILTRNELAWLALDTIKALGRVMYDDPVITMVRAGLKYRLDAAMPGFREQIQQQDDERAEGNAKADAAERERRRKIEPT